MEPLVIAGKTLRSRLLLGTGKFSSTAAMEAAVVASGTDLVTVALRRVNLQSEADDILTHLMRHSLQLLPNTSGVRTAREAVFAAQMAREALQTNWLKLEIHPDPRHLLPDNEETLIAATELVKLGFVVLPYCSADPILCRRLEDVGCAAVMPLGAPIGSNRGLETKPMLRLIIAQATIPVIIDAGIGAPSQAAEAMEMGADAVLVNTAIAVARDPTRMAAAFAKAVQAGREAYESGLGSAREEARASSPLTSFLSEI